MKYSSFADDFFTYHTTADLLLLPVCCPRPHLFGLTDYQRPDDWPKFERDFDDRPYNEDRRNQKITVSQSDDQVAYIHEDEIRDYIVPWLEKMKRVVRDKEHNPSIKDKDPRDLPQIDIPEELERKIHLYNVMLLLSIPRFFQRPLIDALVLEMYQTNLRQCHLDTLEMTVGRFYARGVLVLNPVLSHFVGTDAFRSIVDRQQPEPSEEDRFLHPGPPLNGKRKYPE